MNKTFGAVLGLTAVLGFAASAHAQGTPSSVSPPWQFADVGVVGTPGNAQQASASSGMHVSGAGSDIWGTADSFAFVYQPVRDGSVDATLSSESNTSPFAKAGVMIRQTLDPGSPQVILDVKPDGGIEFMTRSSPGGQTTFIAAGSAVVSTNGDGSIKMNVVLRLDRLGHMVTAAYCDLTAGGSCVQIGSTEFPDGPALTGLAVTSHDPATLNQANFDTPPKVTSVPFPWESADVGVVGTAGVATYEDATGRFFISGAGSDIWGTADSFHWVTQPLTLNSQLTARVVSEDNTNAFAKAGLTMSEFGAGGQRVILDVKPDGGIELMARSTRDGAMAFIVGSTASFPVWLRLTRSGSDFTGEQSTDGVAWTMVGSVDVSLSPTVPGGFAVTSHDPAALNTAVFDNVALTTVLSAGPLGPNLLATAGFEDSIPPATGPAWVSDTPLRQTPAVSETTLPQTGQKNAACRTTSGDCGLYQDITPSNLSTGNLLLSLYARADHAGALVGVNVDGKPAVSTRVLNGGYQRYTIGLFLGGFTSNPNPVIRVWMYAPPTAGVVAIDDVQLTEYFGPQ
jgi:hypothetical protein